MNLKNLFSRLIIVRLEGGMGNQMFQLANAREIQKFYGGVIIFDLHCYNGDNSEYCKLEKFAPLINVDFRSTIFTKALVNMVRIRFKLISIISNRLEKFVDVAIFEQSLGLFYQRDTILKPRKFCFILFRTIYVHGYWMSVKYFESAFAQVVFDFSLPKLATINNNIMTKIENSESVCVHVRRGDYITDRWADQLLICNYRYYQDSMDYLKGRLVNPVFFIFSNSYKDIEWIKSNYIFKNPVEFVIGVDDDFAEFQLMTLCKHFILSNSTFSWWSSTLAKSDKKIVIAPDRWNNDKYNMDAIYLDSWNIIEVKTND